jgi:hypothetical protein
MTTGNLDAPVPDSRVAWRYGLLLVLLAWGLEAYALWARPYVPLVDLPDHMARHCLEYLKLTGQPLPEYYDVSYDVLPNLGGDLVVPALLTFLTVPVAAKVFLTLSVFLYWLGPALFLLSCGGFRPAAWWAALLLLPLSFSGHFLWGFLNHYSGLGLAFLVLTHYLWLAKQERIRPLGLVVHAALVALLLLWHFAPFGVYCVVLACHLAVTTWQRWRMAGGWIQPLGRAALLALPLLPALFLYAYYSAHHAGIDPSVRWNWGGWARKLIQPLLLFHTYGWKCDLIVAFLWLAAALLVFGPGSIRSLRPNWPMLAVAALTTLYLIIPFQLATTDDTDARILPAVLVCALAVLVATWRPIPLPRSRLRVVAALLGICLVVRLGSVIHVWNGLEQRLEPLAAAMDRLAPDSRVLPVLLFPEVSKDYPERHFLAWAVPTKHIFYQGLLHHRDQQPLVFLVPAPFSVQKENDYWEVEGAQTRQYYDYVCVVSLTGKMVRVPPEFERVYDSGAVTLWRVR